MAFIRIHGTNERIENQEEVQAFLDKEGVIYEQWNIGKLSEDLQENFTLTDENKGQILALFDQEISEISVRRGYKAQDVIVLSENTPNLDQLLVNFKQEHHHTDDEVRFIVSGHGIFAIQGQDDNFFDVELSPGDLISVPPNTRHYFQLQDDRRVVAVRIFVTTEGWVPIY
ncbi:1,2-dihydroxy-3-keto-5-methylthiopentene dioxygenase [Priestia taiwanensis]|uniref:Acireductone dioxygenase n=1 Tax=Priestia taiwanensis TaxID=1347902 RepID=A0A917ATB1_9BACI|nr:cupin domain-containing protein [Priestia taiwanensis]MBM7363238.1 1,2-dihydroxy-3-keto-5-methylthiopentene dioxygenase [Priestia taiwanensis]GGE68814.1 acireductone dioxygenase [Priestia taiwanensis]